MKPSFKTFLLWLLIAVLPLHAAATTVGMSCGAVHQKAMQIAFVDHAHHDDIAEVTEVTVYDHHHNHSANSLSDDSSMTADTSAGTAHQHSTCSNCTASCVGVAGPPSAFHSTPAILGTEMVVISPALLTAGIIPGGLERPPRHIFA